MTTLVDVSPAGNDPAPRAAAGDRDAFGALFRMHAPAVFDLAARLLRDRYRAVDVARRAFVAVWNQIDGTDPAGHDVEVLLLGAAARLALEDLGAERPRTEGNFDLELIAAEPALADPQSPRYTPELADVVWTAAAAMEPADYALADLWVRRHFGVEDIAAALGVSERRAARRGPKVLEDLDATVVALIVARTGTVDCDRLARCLEDVPGHASHQRIRAAVEAHLDDGCLPCAVKRSSVVAPADVLGALANIPFPQGVELDSLWLEVRDDLVGPRTRSRRRQARRAARTAVVAGLTVVLLGVGVVAFALGGGDGPPVPVLRDPSAVRSPSHDVGRESERDRIRIVWDRHPTAAGFSVEWSLDRPRLPDQTVDLPGSATGTTSPSLIAGSWWFTLRTRGPDGSWTSTATLGPFIVVPETVDESPESTTSSSSTTTSSTVRTSTTRLTTTTTARPAAAPTPTPTSGDEQPPSPRPTRRSTTTTTSPPPETTQPPTTTTTTPPPPTSTPEEEG